MILNISRFAILFAEVCLEMNILQGKGNGKSMYLDFSSDIQFHEQNWKLKYSKLFTGDSPFIWTHSCC